MRYLRQHNVHRPCAECGKAFSSYVRPRDLARGKGRFCSKRCAVSYAHREGPPRNYSRGANHYAWAGDSISEKGGRKRALRMFPIGPCESCGKDAFDRHHKDGNTANNSPGNIALLCRKCHMVADGRLEEFRRMAKTKGNHDT